MSLIRLVYASDSRLVEAHRQDEIGRIVGSARRRNESNGVTGFLMVTPSAFAQVLEGEQHDVAETFGRIVVDPRHTGLRLLTEERIRERSFPTWSMGLAERDETTAFIFRLCGISPTNDLPVQPADALLDLAGQLARQNA